MVSLIGSTSPKGKAGIFDAWSEGSSPRTMVAVWAEFPAFLTAAEGPLFSGASIEADTGANAVPPFVGSSSSSESPPDPPDELGAGGATPPPLVELAS